MATQSINNYYFNRYDIRLDSSSYFDITLASDARGYDEEVVYSEKLIGEDDGNRLPINIDLNSVYCNPKEDLKLAELNYGSLKEFYEYFINDFLVDEEKRTISEPVYKKNGTINFVECDASYLDKDANIEIYYLVGIVETKDNYYKVLSWSSVDNKAKFKEDFRKILYSVRD
jgi:hypothetical protein